MIAAIIVLPLVSVFHCYVSGYPTTGMLNVINIFLFLLRLPLLLLLLQEQDAVGGRFDSSQSFKGSLTNVNVWSYVLSASTIESLSKSCLSWMGNVYKWSDFIYGVKGKAAVVIPSPCYPLSTQGCLLRGLRHIMFNLFKKYGQFKQNYSKCEVKIATVKV